MGAVGTPGQPVQLLASGVCPELAADRARRAPRSGPSGGLGFLSRQPGVADPCRIRCPGGPGAAAGGGARSPSHGYVVPGPARRPGGDAGRVGGAVHLVLAAQRQDRDTVLRLTQDPHDLGVREPTLLHPNLLVRKTEKILRPNPLISRGDYRSKKLAPATASAREP